MARRQQEESSRPGIAAWWLTYADVITLMMTFFVLLMTFQTVDTRKFQDLAGAMRSMLGAFKCKHIGNSDVRPSQLRAGQQEMGGVEAAPSYDELKDVEADFRICLDSVGLAEMVDFSLVERGVLVQVRPELLFEAGEARLKDQDTPVLNALAASIRKLPHPVRVIGHGDRFFLPSQQFPTNPTLALARAGAVCEYLSKRCKMPAARLQACARSADTDEAGAVIEALILRPPRGGFRL